MNSFRLERIPLPEFSTYLIYTALSLIGSALRLSYVVLQTGLRPNLSNETTVAFTATISSLCVEDTWFFWSCINFAYCLLICAGRELQHLFFGELRESENTNIRENFSNFIFYKVVFVYGILNVDALHELLLWAGWFSILGFLHLLTGLAKDRLEYIVQSSNHIVPPLRILCLLLCILVSGNLLTAISVAFGTRYSLNLMCFMLAEVFQLAVKALYVVVWYAIHLYSEAATAQRTSMVEFYHKSLSVYHANMLFSSVSDLGDVLHNVHLLCWNGIRVNMSAIIVGMHLQHLYHKLSKRFRHHKHYQKLIHMLDSRSIRASKPDQDCVVCWEKLTCSRQLPCGHIFHLACLHIWIERSADCPICRTPLDVSGWVLPSNSKLGSLTSNPRPSNLSDAVHLPSTLGGTCSPIDANSEDMYLTENAVVSSSRDLTEHACGASEECFGQNSFGVGFENSFFRPDKDLGSNPHSLSALVSINSFLNLCNEPLRSPGSKSQLLSSPRSSLSIGFGTTPKMKLGSSGAADFHVFHPSPERRKQSLEQRKQNLLQRARLKFSSWEQPIDF
ncbi:Autocrine motility factor receptor [Clonorchis sinensis]|uniref:Autocrine motility factor receptor n=1 Tax=Clonorchis sinensis TaxID=79923 RepID=A0A3R7JLI3_CLOSI|nr:Autocrine motility factor receptor [Clonorchis sinensis]